ncbi:MAG: BlaI/MecI/CopY family transcriptional regulator [Clostridiales bacterium]|nr:BlaI/MecI/CopY family transcriptional regulator [Clostridiales bacterium]
MRETLSKNEWIIMETLWQRAPLYLSELMVAMKTSVDWNRSSYLTYLKRMADQGLVGFETVRGSRRYVPLLRRDECVEAESDALLGRMSEQSAKLLLVSMVQKSGLGETDRKALQELIARLGGGPETEA